MEPSIPSYSFDIRAEVAASMLSYFVSIDEKVLHFDMQGKFASRVDPEFMEVEFLELEEGEEIVRVTVNRMGMIANLPEMSYLRSLEGEPTAREFSDAKKAHLYARQLKEAISFFSPFDQAFFEPLVQLAQHELALPESIIESLFDEQEWEEYVQPVAKVLSTTKQEEENTLVRIKTVLKLGILISERIQADYEITARFFEEVLQVPVKIMLRDQQPVEILPEYQFILGNSNLGENAIIGKHFLDGIPTVELQIHDIPLVIFHAFLEEGAIWNFLNQVLIPLFLPLEASTNIRIFVQAHNFHLGKVEQGSILGYTTQL